MSNLFDPYNLNSIGAQQIPLQRMMVPNPPQINAAPQQQRDLEKVNGIESARQYIMPPNSRVALFDINDDIFYVRETDASGFPTIRKFRFYEEIENNVQTQETQYLTLDEFNKFKEELINGEFSIPFKSGATTTTSTGNAKSKSGKPKTNDADV